MEEEGDIRCAAGVCFRHLRPASNLESNSGYPGILGLDSFWPKDSAVYIHLECCLEPHAKVSISFLDTNLEMQCYDYHVNHSSAVYSLVRLSKFGLQAKNGQLWKAITQVHNQI